MYYFRYVFHNCSDETGLRIIRNHIPAMGPKSVMVIDENVLPDDKPAPGTPGAEASAGLSLAMKMIFNSQERRKGQWQTLFQGSGLAIKDIRQYTDLTESAIILAKEA